MKEEVKFEEVRYFSNTISVFESLVFQNKNENETKLSVHDIENIIPHAKAGLLKFYDLEPNLRMQGFEYLHKSILEIRNTLNENEAILREERLTFLEIFEEIVNKIFSAEKKASPKMANPYSLKQQILLMHYLGLLDVITAKFKYDNKRNEFISALLNRDVSNVKKAVKNINNNSFYKGQEIVKTEENLKAVKTIFEDLNLIDVVEKIQVDMNKIKKG